MATTVDASTASDATVGTANTGASATGTSQPTTTGTGPGGLDLLPDSTTGEPGGCERPGGCHRLDVLLVVDNSAWMADKQKNFAAALPHLVERLRSLVGSDGVPVEPDVQVMTTTTDCGHFLCDGFEKPDYDPAMGAPIATACAERLTRFTGLGGNVEVREDVCLDHCPADAIAVPTDPFVAFAGDTNNITISDGEGDVVVDALKCVAPQGIDGCGLESPLQSMRAALTGGQPWNMGPRPFLREGAALAIVILTDEADCSTADPRYFDPKLQNDPEFGKYYEAQDSFTSVCWNGSMTCEDANADGVYESCVPEDKGVLKPLSDYVAFLRDHLEGELSKPVFMLAITGIPASGIDDLVYHDWTEADMLPGDEESPSEMQAEFAIGPGCSAQGVGYALPPGRIRELCEALDVADDPNTPLDEARVRCCFDSVCETDLSGGIDCLVDALSHSLQATP